MPDSRTIRLAAPGAVLLLALFLIVANTGDGRAWLFRQLDRGQAGVGTELALALIPAFVGSYPLGFLLTSCALGPLQLILHHSPHLARMHSAALGELWTPRCRDGAAVLRFYAAVDLWNHTRLPEHLKDYLVRRFSLFVTAISSVLGLWVALLASSPLYVPQRFLNDNPHYIEWRSVLLVCGVVSALTTLHAIVALCEYREVIRLWLSQRDGDLSQEAVFGRWRRSLRVFSAPRSGAANQQVPPRNGLWLVLCFLVALGAPPLSYLVWPAEPVVHVVGLGVGLLATGVWTYAWLTEKTST